MSDYLDRFSRRTSSGRFIPQIDGLRFVAIALVFLFHVEGYVREKSPAAPFSGPLEEDWFYRLSAVGNHGVELFFVISGFILALPFALHHLQDGKRIRLKNYYLRRLTRLEPPYILNLTLLVPLVVLSGRATIGEDIPHFGASLLYLHNVMYGGGSLINVAAWSLEIEIQFYILVPLLVMVFRIRPPHIRRSLVLITCVGFITLQNTFSAALPLNLFSFLQFFLMGLLLADVYVVSWKQTPVRHVRWI